jgi:hypothetical protein
MKSTSSTLAGILTFCFCLLQWSHASAEDWPAPYQGQCGSASYGSANSIGGGSFAKRLSYVNSRLKSLCTQSTKQLQQNIHQAVASCQLGTDVGNALQSRWGSLCDGAKEAVKAANDFCDKYDAQGVGTATYAKKQLKGIGMNNVQSGDFKTAADVAGTARDVNKIISADADAAKATVEKAIPKNNGNGNKGSDADAKMDALAKRSQALASATQGCANLDKVVNSAGSAVKNNLFPNIRVLADGLGSISDYAKRESQKMANMAGDLDSRANSLKSEETGVKAATIPGGDPMLQSEKFYQASAPTGGVTANATPAADPTNNSLDGQFSGRLIKMNAPENPNYMMAVPQGAATGAAAFVLPTLVTNPAAKPPMIIHGIQ